MKRRARRITPPSKNRSKIRKLKTRIRQFGYGDEVPPDPSFVAIYFDQQQQPNEAERFYQCYEKLDWRTVTGKPIRNWKVLASDWIFDRRQEEKRSERLNRFQ